ncbi:hypothetical protein [Aquimarina sp. AU474]|uniref:hypothetical protein n=1 Tax=Aquimarina sp. AU474 TaxID=2108529 RepID=UPI000D69723C|nr:hypothetical protein [Aquimarina sp. AU474]
MILRNDKKNTTPLKLFKPLFDRDSLQILEWSIKITRDRIEPSCKPTFYVYHKDEDFSNYYKLNALLAKVAYPKDILDIQEKGIPTSMYNGLRIPLMFDDHKCLYINEEGEHTIRSLRWKNKESYDELRYIFKNDLEINDSNGYVHQELKDYYTSISQKDRSNICSGIWFQEMNDRISELYLAFPERPKLKWIIKELKSYMSNKTYKNVWAYSDLRCKNIGFDSHIAANLAITIYFSIPVGDMFPDNYIELMDTTHDFFCYIKKAKTSFI